MRTFLIVLSACFFLLTTSITRISAQQPPDIQKEIELMKKSDKKMQYSLSKCGKELKALNKKMDENLKNINSEVTALKTNIDTLQSNFNNLQTSLTKKQDELNSKIQTISIRIWLCVLILLLIAAYIFFGVIGAIKRNKVTIEAKLINDKEALDHAIKKTEKELLEKLHLLEQQLAGLKK